MPLPTQSETAWVEARYGHKALQQGYLGDPQVALPTLIIINFRFITQRV